MLRINSIKKDTNGFEKHILKPAVLGCLILFSVVAFSQNYKTSGYLGRKNILSVRANLYPSLQPQSSTGNSPAITLNKEYQVDFTRVIKSYFAVTLCGGQSATSVVVNESGESGERVWHHTPEEYNEELREVSGRPSIKDRFYGLKLKYYLRNRGALAPLGIYTALGCNFHNYTINYSNIRMVMLTDNPFTGEEYRNYKLKSPIHRYKVPDINLAMGLNRAIGRSLITDIGVQLGGLLFEKKPIPPENTSGVDPIGIHLENTTLGRARGFNICKIYFSLGLIF